MIGLSLALISTFAFALSNVSIRKGVARTGESYSPVPISLLAGMILFALTLVISGEIRLLTALSGSALVSFASAGIVHFVFGRTLAFTGIRLIGANRSSPILTSNILITTILGIVFFNEPVTINLVLGFTFITGGVLILSGAGQPATAVGDSNDVNRLKGVLASLGGAFCWGISPMLVKLGFSGGASPLQGGFISYVAASVVMAFSLSHRGNVEKIRKLNRYAMIPIIVGSMAVGIAQLFRYYAIENSPISLVAQIMATSPLFVLPLSFVINRSIEAFSMRIIFGTVATVMGVLLIFRVA